MYSSGIRRRVLGAIAAVLVVLVGVPLVADPKPAGADTMPADPTEPVTFSADALPTVQVNGVVWATVIMGDRVFATGEFTHARPSGAAPGTNETARSNILAFNLHTGALIQSWNASLNAQGMALEASADGTTVYVAGDFTSVNGQTRNRVAALDVNTGALRPFNTNVNARVQALERVGNTLYIGGDFSLVNGQTRSRIAAVNATTGTTIAGWAPAPDDTVFTMVAHEPTGRLIIGGYFRNVNDVQNRGTAALSLANGAALDWAMNDLIKNHGPGGTINALVTDGERIYGSGSAWHVPTTGSVFEGVFAADPATGEIDWINGCRGDTYDLALSGPLLYAVNHAHECTMVGDLNQQYPSQYQRAQAMTTYKSPDGAYLEYGHGPSFAFAGYPGRPRPQILHWMPALSAGTYTGQNQGPWAADANSDYLVLGGEFPTVNGTARQGLVRFAKREIAPNTEPVQGFPELQPELTPLGSGRVRVAWKAAFDRDNKHLKVEVLRGPNAATATVLETRTTATTWWDRPLLSYIDQSAPPGSTQTYRIRVTDPYGNGFAGPANTVVIPAGVPQGETYRDSVRADGPSNYWRFDEASGNETVDWGEAVDVRTDSSVTLGAPGALIGAPNTAASFAGYSDPTLNVAPAVAEQWRLGPQTFTLEAWVKTTSTTGGKIIGFGKFDDRRNHYNEVDRHIYMTNDGQFRFGVRPDMGQRSTIASPTGFNDGEWHHVVASLSATGMKLHVDGHLVGADPSVTKAQVYWGFWRIGGDRVMGDHWLNNWPASPTHESIEATIDEVAVYPHELPTSRIQAHYRASGREGDFPNVAPNPRINAQLEGNTITLDGTASTDDDGTVVAYAWDFGDGQTATGPTAQHTYAAPGAYLVTLTVTDDDAASASAYQPAAIPHIQPDFARDEFSRSAVNGWGVADIGGAWTAQGPLANLSVDGSRGRIAGDVGATRGSHLQGISRTDFDVMADVSLDRAATGGGAYASVLARRVGTTTDYRLHLRYQASGPLIAYLIRKVNNVDTTIAWATLTGVTPAPGDVFRTRFQVSGTAPTTLRAKVWRNGTPEPQNWTVTGVDTATPAVLQAPGNLGLQLYLSSSWTGPAPVLSVDNLRASTDLTPGDDESENLAPLAHFTWSNSYLAAAFDASTSFDVDGQITSYEWNFGDGGSGTGVSPSHVYEEAGTYPVTLTVTDDDGAARQFIADVAVTDPPPPPPNIPPVAVIDHVERALELTVSGGNSSDPDGHIVSYEWDFGDGNTGVGNVAGHVYEQPGTYTVTLTVTDDRGGTHTVTAEIKISVLVFDAFNRTVAIGWGAAPFGGPWTTHGAEDAFSVSHGNGWITGDPIEVRRAVLAEVAEQDVDVFAEFQLRTEVGLPIGGDGARVSILARRDEDGNDYRLTLWYRPNGTVRAYLIRTEQGVQTVLAQAEIPQLVVVSGDLVRVRFRARGAESVNMNARVWREGWAEPSIPQVFFTDENPPVVLRDAGAVGVEFDPSDTWTETQSLLGIQTLDVARAVK